MTGTSDRLHGGEDRKPGRRPRQRMWLGLCWDQTSGGSWVGWRPEVTETSERCMEAETGGQGGDQGEDCE